MNKVYNFLIFTILLFFSLLGIFVPKVNALSDYYINLNYNQGSMGNMEKYLSTLMQTFRSNSKMYIITNPWYGNSGTGDCFQTVVDGYSSCSVSLVRGDVLSIKTRNRSGYTSGIYFSGTNVSSYESLLLYRNEVTGIIYMNDKSTVLNQSVFPSNSWWGNIRTSMNSNYFFGIFSYSSWTNFPLTLSNPNIFDTNVSFVNINDTYDFDLNINNTIYSGDDFNVFPSWKNVFDNYYQFDQDISDDDIYEYSFNIDISSYSDKENIPLDLTSSYYSKGGLDYQVGQDFIYSKLKAPFLRITYADGSISLEDDIVDDSDSDTIYNLNYHSDLYNRSSNRIAKVELVYDMSYTTDMLLHISLISNLNFTTSYITDQYYHENNNLVQLVLTGKYAVVFSPRTTAINQDNNVNFELHSALGFDVQIWDTLDFSNLSNLYGTDKNIKDEYYYFSVSKSNPERYLVFYNLSYGKYNYGNDYAVTIWYNSNYFTYCIADDSTSSCTFHNDNTNEDVSSNFLEKNETESSKSIEEYLGLYSNYFTQNSNEYNFVKSVFQIFVDLMPSDLHNPIILCFVLILVKAIFALGGWK